MQTVLINLVEEAQHNLPTDGEQDITAALPRGVTLNKLIPVVEFLKANGWTGMDR